MYFVLNVLNGKQDHFLGNQRRSDGHPVFGRMLKMRDRACFKNLATGERRLHANESHIHSSCNSNVQHSMNKAFAACAIGEKFYVCELIVIDHRDDGYSRRLMCALLKVSSASNNIIIYRIMYTRKNQNSGNLCGDQCAMCVREMETNSLWMFGRSLLLQSKIINKNKKSLNNSIFVWLDLLLTARNLNIFPSGSLYWKRIYFMWQQIYFPCRYRNFKKLVEG